MKVCQRILSHEKAMNVVQNTVIVEKEMRRINPSSISRNSKPMTVFVETRFTPNPIDVVLGLEPIMIWQFRE